MEVSISPQKNSLPFVKSPLISPRNDVGETSTEIPYWWRVTIEVWVVLLIGGSKFSANQKLYPDLDNDVSLVWNFALVSQSLFRVKTFDRRHEKSAVFPD